MFKVLRKYSNNLSNALLQICLKQETINCNIDLGGNVFSYAKSPYRCVQIRQFEELDQIMLPTKTGISLKRAQWYILLDIFERIEKDYSTPKKLNFCNELHANQEDFFTCPDCFPAGISSP